MLIKPKNLVDYMLVYNVSAAWWNNIIANPLVKKNNDDTPLAIFGKTTDEVHVNKHGYMRCIKENVEEIYALPVDVDNGTSMEWFETDFQKYSYQLYTTYSWHNGKEGDRFRVFFPLKEPIKVRWLVKPVKEILINMFSMADTSCFDQAHWQRLPCISSRDADYRYVQHQGDLLSFAHHDFGKIAEEYENDMKAYYKKLDEERDPDEDRTWLLRCVQKVFDETYEGERDRTVFREVSSMIRKGCTYEEIMSLTPPAGFEREYEKKVRYVFSRQGR